MDTNNDKIWEIVQRLYALAGLLQRCNGEAFDNDVLPGLGHHPGGCSKNDRGRPLQRIPEIHFKRFGLSDSFRQTELSETLFRENGF